MTISLPAPARRGALLPFASLAAAVLCGQALGAQLTRRATTWEVKDEAKISAQQGSWSKGLGFFDYFGLSTSSADLDGDGRREFLVGAPGDDDSGIDNGAFYVFTLAADGSIVNEVKVTQGQGGFASVLSQADYFGRSLACIGDLDDDGVDDLAVGAYRDDDGGIDAGALYILFMMPDGTVKASQKISVLSGGFTGAVLAGDVFGIRSAPLGDLDGDGVEDIVVTASLTDSGGHDRGAIYVLFMQTDGTVKAQQKIAPGIGGFTGTLQDDDYFGCHAVPTGDLDGDGVIDIAVGAFGDDDGGPGTGAIYVLFLQTDGTVKSHRKISSSGGGLPGGVGVGDNFGSSMAFVGDPDGDGSPTIVVGAYNDDDGGANRGAIWFLDLRPDGTVRSFRKVSDTRGGFQGSLKNTDGFGSGLTSLGDIDGDGMVDVGVGAWFDNDNSILGGAAWVLRMRTPSRPRAAGPISAASPTTAGAEVRPGELWRHPSFAEDTAAHALTVVADEGGRVLASRRTVGPPSLRIPDETVLVGQRLTVATLLFGDGGARLLPPVELLVVARE